MRPVHFLWLLTVWPKGSISSIHFLRSSYSSPHIWQTKQKQFFIFHVQLEISMKYQKPHFHRLLYYIPEAKHYQTTLFLGPDMGVKVINFCFSAKYLQITKGRAQEQSSCLLSGHNQNAI